MSNKKLTVIIKADEYPMTNEKEIDNMKFSRDWLEPFVYCFNNDSLLDEMNKRYVVEPKKIIFNDPATIVYWKDGTKTVVKASKDCGDKFDEEVGLAMAYMNKIFGGRSNFLKMVNKAKGENYEL